LKWFQHSVDSHDDPDISDAWDEFGDAAVVVFWVLLEIYGREFNNLDEEGKLTISKTFLRRKLRKSWTKAQQILNFYQKKNRIFHSTNGDDVTILVPQFIEIASNWTKRPKPEKNPNLCSPSVAPTAIEEKKKRIEENITKEPAVAVPSSKHFKDNTGELREQIETHCTTISKLPTKKKFNPWQFVQECANKKQHPAAIEYVLTGLIKAWPTVSDPWPYANAAMKIESPKRYALDADKLNQQEKREWEELVNNLKAFKERKL